MLGRMWKIFGLLALQFTASQGVTVLAPQSAEFGVSEQDCIGSPECPVWPEQFSAPFGLYNHFPSIANASSTFYYKYSPAVKAQMIDYHTRCFPFVNVGTLLFENPCKFYFNPSGIYFSQPQRGIKCCLFVKGVGAVPTNFLRSYHLAGNEVVKDYWDRDVHCQRWDADEDFKYWTVDHGDKVYPEEWGHDIVFQDGPTGVTWRWGLFDVKEQNNSIFELPGTAAECSQSCSWFQDDAAREAAMKEPHVRMAQLDRRLGQSVSGERPKKATHGGGGQCKAQGDEEDCEKLKAGGCKWCVTIDLEWCQAADKPCKE